MWLNGSPTPAESTRGPTTAQLGQIPEGMPGAAATVKAMRQLVLDAVRDPSQKVRETALQIIGRSSFVEQAKRLQAWVQDNIAYVHDPPSVELVQTPQYTLQQRAGDCDDQATLLAALFDATGHPARFIAVGLRGEPLSHVLTQTLVGTQWLGAETIIKRPFGWMPSGVTSHYILKV